MNRNTRRKQLVGTVVSTKNSKTLAVAVDTYQMHPIYGKRFKVTKKFAVHDENESAKLGDQVQIAETRPYSKTKTFRLVKILQPRVGDQ
ncbi:MULTISPECIES: 30S ribosomal protein S17 [unclassified Mycoplasma]|uniref:30S ribosomal protein S17 n=1 Tax=unclassified Mycoplasma TaxID=2683645 RepID=UPI000FDED0E6